MKRKLGNFETAEVITNQHFPFNAIGVFKLSGDLSEDTLRKAIDQLSHRHPLLKVQVKQEKKHFYFETNGKPIPLDTRKRGSEDQWLTVVEEELNRKLDIENDQGLRLIYLVPEDNSYERELIVTFQHAIVDSASGVQLVHELLTLCQTIEEGGDVGTMEPLSLMPYSESMFPPAYQGLMRKWRLFKFMLHQMRNEFAYRRAVRKRRKAPVILDGKCRVFSLKLPEELTSELFKKTRRKRVTINNLFNAAMLMAAQKHLYNGKARRLRNYNFANLRPYLVPPMEPQFMGSYFALLPFDAPVPENSEVWDLADNVNKILYGGLKRGDKFCFSILSPMFMRMAFKKKNMRMGDTAMSYIGNIDISNQYGQIHIHDVHAFVSNFGLGPEYTCHVRLFDKTFYWDVVYLDSDMNEEKARIITREIFNILEEAAKAR